MNRRNVVRSSRLDRSICLFVSLGFAVVFVTPVAAQKPAASAAKVGSSADTWGALNALGVEIQPGTKQKLSQHADE